MEIHFFSGPEIAGIGCKVDGASRNTFSKLVIISLELPSPCLLLLTYVRMHCKVDEKMIRVDHDFL